MLTINLTPLPLPLPSDCWNWGHRVAERLMDSLYNNDQRKRQCDLNGDNSQHGDKLPELHRITNFKPTDQAKRPEPGIMRHGKWRALKQKHSGS